MTRILSSIFAAALMLASPLIASADDVQIGGAVFTVSDLETGFPGHEITTMTTWTGDRTPVFRGPKAIDVLSAMGLGGKSMITITAGNGYQTDVPMEVIRTHDPILALRVDGKTMPRRAKGPAWLIFDRSGSGGAISDAMDSYWVWSIVSIE